MKKMLFIAVIALVSLASCKKEDMSKYVKKTDLEQGSTAANPKIENIDLTIEPYQWQWDSSAKSWVFSVSHGFINEGVLVGYVMKGGLGKQSLPYYDPNVEAFFGLADMTFSDKINVTYYDGSNSIARPAYSTFVYLKIIPSAQIKENVDYSNYEEVAKAHNF